MKPDDLVWKWKKGEQESMDGHGQQIMEGSCNCSKWILACMGSSHISL
jgi:hypothetical protein